MNLHLKKRHFYMLLAVVSVVILACLGAYMYQANQSLESQKKVRDEQTVQFHRILSQYDILNTKIMQMQDQGVDVAVALEERTAIVALIHAGEWEAADAKITATLALLDTLLNQKLSAVGAELGTLSGKVTSTDKVALATATVALSQNTTTLASGVTSATGEYALTVGAGTYTVTTSKSGYTTSSQSVVITAQQTVTLDITLTKIVATTQATPAPVPTTSTSLSSAYTKYEYKGVVTAVGSFNVHVITAEIGAGKARLVTDTANDSDCLDNCPTLSLASYVSRNGGVAGINGTYFCPADYSWCAGKVNTFLYRIYNTRLGKLINASNDDTALDPVIAMTTGGTPRYYSTWNSFAGSLGSVSAAINSGPALVENGAVVVNVSKLDDKQRYTKSNRGALGLKGSTLYAVVGKSATVVDMAYVMQSLGADYAMNLDGGGSSGLYYTGGYKVGPGRSLPNAVIIAE